MQKYPGLLISWETSPHFATPPLVSSEMRNDRRNSILMCLTTHWLEPLIAIMPQEKFVLTIQKIRVVTRHKYGVSSRVTLASVRRETSGGVAKRRLFSQATSTSCFRNFLGCCKGWQQESITSCNPWYIMPQCVSWLFTGERGGFLPPAPGLEGNAVFPGQRWFSNRTGASVDDGARKSNNWLDQWLSGKLCTGSRV